MVIEYVQNVLHLLERSQGGIVFRGVLDMLFPDFSHLIWAGWLDEWFAGWLGWLGWAGWLRCACLDTYF